MSLSVFFLFLLRKKSSSKSTKPTNSINKKVQIQFALLRDLYFLCWRKIRETLRFTN